MVVDRIEKSEQAARKRCYRDESERFVDVAAHVVVVDLRTADKHIHTREQSGKVSGGKDANTDRKQQKGHSGHRRRERRGPGLSG